MLSFVRHYLALAARELSKYEVMGLSPDATIKQVKSQFKALSKKHHPDLNTHLPDDEKKQNNDRFVLIVSAYDTLKDSHKKLAYDRELQRGRAGASTVVYSAARKNQEWHNKYYGEAKYYSRAGNSGYGPGGLNNQRHRVHYNPDAYNHATNSTFSGRHVNYGDRYDVPHFDYQQHLSKHLKFEQRILNKNLSDADRNAIMEQLSKNSGAKVDEELLTKHLMRQAKRPDVDAGDSGFQPPDRGKGRAHSYASPTGGYSPNRAYMYEKPHSDGTALKAFALLGAGGSLYYIWSLFS